MRPSSPRQARRKKPASPTAFSATSGVTCGGALAGLDDEVGDMLALRDRRLQRALIDDPRADVLAEALRVGDRQRPRRDQADRGGVAALHLRLADPLALASKRPRLPGAEAPLHEAHRFVGPLVEARQAGDDHHQPPPVLLGRAGEAEAGLGGMAGLEPVRARHAAEQRIAVALGDRLVAAHRPAPGEFAHAVIFAVELRDSGAASETASRARSRAVV